MKIKKNNKPDLPKVNFLCDFPIHSKLDDYELTKDFMNKPNTTVFLGRQGSGKTSLCINFITKIYKKCFHNIYVFMRESSRRSLKENIFDKYLDPSQIFEDLTPESIYQVYEMLKQNSKENEYSLIIFDDVQDGLKNPLVLMSLKKIVANQRHLKVVNFLLLQNWMALDPSLRRIINNLIVFKMDKVQQEQIFESIFEGEKMKFDEINKLVYDEPYRWLFINVPSQRIFKEWDEILLKE
jgi:hypothetical protein